MAARSGERGRTVATRLSEASTLAPLSLDHDRTALSHSRPRLESWRGLRFVLMGTSAAALAAGLCTGLLRLGLPLADGMPTLAN